ncbi:ATP-binding protein [Streptomyces sp. NBC_00435]|uniref:ATP-binding protein n=2 Tax=Streptomyces sp. NBC_00435 TaxID=2903649 RepID=UPI002E21C792
MVPGVVSRSRKGCLASARVGTDGTPMIAPAPASATAEPSVASRDFRHLRAPVPGAGTRPEAGRCEGASERITWYLDFSLEAAAMARRAIQPYLLRWGLDAGKVDTARLLVSELVANAVKHGEPPVFLYLAHGEGTVTITVQDAGHGPSRPQPDPQDTSAEDGRGLFLVEALCDYSRLTCTPNGTLATGEIGI